MRGSVMGERRHRLPLQRKVKQLQRPWHRAVAVSEADSRRCIWGASQPRKKRPQRAPRSQSSALAVPHPSPICRSSTKRGLLSSSSSGGLTTRRRPSTGTASSPLQQGHFLGAWAYQSSSADDFNVVGWGRFETTPAVPAPTSGVCNLPSARGNAGLAEKHSVGTADATVNSSLSVPSIFTSIATPTTDTVNARGGQTPLGQDGADISSRPETRVVFSTKATTTNFLRPAGSRVTTKVVGRPTSAGVGRSAQARMLKFTLRGDKISRPHTAGPSSPSKAPASATLEFGERHIGQRTYTESVSASSTDNARDAETSTGRRASVAVTLPLLVEAGGMDDAKFTPGSDLRSKSPTGLESDTAVSAPSPTLLIDTEKTRVATQEEGKAEHDEEDRSQAKSVAKRTGKNTMPLRYASPPIGVLGYFVAEDYRYPRRTRSSFNGRALIGGRSRSAPLNRPLKPALLPGEPRYGIAHPLSPTSMGNPPRRHRNSNWGEEGVRLSCEELEKSRNTVPFVVSSTMLGWKISTRGRKNSLEAALQSADYSQHHPVPVYGFRYADDWGHGTKEHRQEQRRLEARALAAERAALERRSRAEGGAEGAAFARAMSRRALARADRIQKMGDVDNHRQKKLQSRSSPRTVNVYRKLVRARTQAIRSKQRAARGLPPQRSPKIAAVISRADLAGPSALGERSGRAMLEEMPKMLEVEPYLMLLRARSQQQKGGTITSKRAVIQFCSLCLAVGCTGTCSPSGERK